MELHRRNFVGGLLATLAKPAIIRPGILMPVKVIKKNSLLTINQITRETIILWKNANAYWEHHLQDVEVPIASFQVDIVQNISTFGL